MSCRSRTTIDIDKAVHLYVDEKLSCHEVGRRVGCSGRALLDRLRAHGVAIRHCGAAGHCKNAPTAIDETRLRELYVEQHKTAADCARALGVSCAAVLRQLRRLGVQVLPASAGLCKGDVPDERAVSLYWERGLSIPETGRELRKSATWVRNALLRSGRGTRSLSEARHRSWGTAHIDNAELVRLYDEQGWSCQRISRYFGKSRGFAHQRFLAIGKTTRGRLRGAHNPRWKGGCTALHVRLRSGTKMERWRRLCMERDGFTCRLTGQRGGKLHVHHIRPFSKILAEFLAAHADLDPRQDSDRLFTLALEYAPFWDTNNGITLCASAHLQLHVNRLDPALAVRVRTLKERGWSTNRIAKALGRSRNAINRALRIMATASSPECRRVA